MAESQTHRAVHGPSRRDQALVRTEPGGQDNTGVAGEDAGETLAEAERRWRKPARPAAVGKHPPLSAPALGESPQFERGRLVHIDPLEPVRLFRGVVPIAAVPQAREEHTGVT